MSSPIPCENLSTVEASAPHPGKMFPMPGNKDAANAGQSAEALGGALPCKTPVSLLQELCMRRGISPKYDLLQIEGAVHEPTFVYRVTVGEFSASGSGQSKKKAKHSAAKAVLDMIIHGGGGPAVAPPNGAGEGAVAQAAQQAGELSSVISPYDDGIPGNPVGQLQEMCMTRRWPPPTYQLTAEEGFPHERTFAIACTIATYKEIGHGKSKKLAKRQAAFTMMNKLNADMPTEPSQGGEGVEDEEDLAKSLTMRYSGLKESKLKTASTQDIRKMNSFHIGLRRKAGPMLKNLQQVSLSAVTGLNFIQMIQDIAAEANFTATFIDIEEKSLIGDYHCLLQMTTNPIAVTFGSGASVADAQSDAAHHALEYLKVMTKPVKEQQH